MMGADHVDHVDRVDDCLVISTCGFLSNIIKTALLLRSLLQCSGDLVNIITLCRSRDRRVVGNLQKSAAHEECQHIFQP